MLLNHASVRPTPLRRRAAAPAGSHWPLHERTPSRRRPPLVRQCAYSAPRQCEYMHRHCRVPSRIQQLARSPGRQRVIVEHLPQDAYCRIAQLQAVWVHIPVAGTSALRRRPPSRQRPKRQQRGAVSAAEAIACGQQVGSGPTCRPNARTCKSGHSLNVLN